MSEDLLLPEEIASLRELVLGDLYIFAKGILGFDRLDPRIHKPLCRLLELYDGYKETLRPGRETYELVLDDVLKRMKKTGSEAQRLKTLAMDKGVKKLLLILPRDWLKTTIMSIARPQWKALREHYLFGRSYRSLLVQNTFGNSVQKLSMIDNSIYKNSLFRALFSEVLPDASCTWKGESKCLKRKRDYAESTFQAAGTGTQVTSSHWDDITEDDTVAPEKNDLGEENLAPTQAQVAQAIGWHKLALPLLDDQQRGCQYVVGTRWFVKDLLSTIKEGEEDYFIYERACLENSSGEADETGEPTYPEKFPREVLDALRKGMGPYMFSCLYMNKPIRSEDMTFRPEWFEFYETPPRDLVCYTTVDLASDPEDCKGSPDFNVVLTAGKDLRSGKIYVVDYMREQCSPGRVLQVLFDHVKMYHPVKVGVETVSYQKTLMYWMREKMRRERTFFVVEKLGHTKSSKAQRIRGLQPVFASKSIFLRTWMKDLQRELLSFPLGQNDDLPDTLAMQLELWALTSSDEEEKAIEARTDPLGVDFLINELRERAREKAGVWTEMLEERQELKVFEMN
jgi:phage terminase large subunit-like protein